MNFEARYCTNIYFSNVSTVLKDDRPLGEGLLLLFFFVYYSNCMYLFYFLFYQTQKSKNYHTSFLAELGTLEGMGIFTHDPG